MLAFTPISGAAIADWGAALVPYPLVQDESPLRTVTPYPLPRKVTPYRAETGSIIVSAFGPKDLQSNEVFTFDFVNLLGGLTISSGLVEIDLVSGVDPDPDLMLAGDPEVDGTMVLQRLIDGEDGAAYHLRCRALLSDGSVITIGAELDVREF